MNSARNMCGSSITAAAYQHSEKNRAGWVGIPPPPTPPPPPLLRAICMHIICNILQFIDGLGFLNLPITLGLLKIKQYKSKQGRTDEPRMFTECTSNYAT